jgi:hypothetical protein
MEGDIMISRSPTVHPGDARMVRAVGQLPATAPQGLRALRNCVVFSCQGMRIIIGCIDSINLIKLRPSLTAVYVGRW